MHPLRCLRFIFICAALLNSGCGDEKGAIADVPMGPSPLPQYNKDREQVSHLSSSGPDYYDHLHSQAYSKVFGGIEAADVERYFNERISHVWDSDRRFQMKIFDHRHSRFSPMPGVPEKQRASMVAGNLTSGLWLDALANDRDYEMRYNDQSVLVQNSRPGVILLGPNYLNHVRAGQFEIPVEVRLSFMIHEGRHSDCSGGIDASELDLLHKSRGVFGMFKESPAYFSCTYPHVICPEDHEMAGIPACDRQVWGAYGVAGVFTGAMTFNYPEDSIESRILDAVTSDNFSRLIDVDVDKINSTEPDMSSSGLIQ